MQQHSDLMLLIAVHYVHNMVLCCEVHTNAFPSRMLFISKKMFFFNLLFKLCFYFIYIFIIIIIVGNISNLRSDLF